MNPHCLHAVDRKHGRGPRDAQTVVRRPVGEVLAHIGGPRLDRVRARLVDRWVHSVEDPAHQDRLVDQLRAGSGRNVCDPMEGQIGPRTPHVVEELERRHGTRSYHATPAKSGVSGLVLAGKRAPRSRPARVMVAQHANGTNG